MKEMKKIVVALMLMPMMALASLTDGLVAYNPSACISERARGRFVFSHAHVEGGVCAFRLCRTVPSYSL